MSRQALRTASGKRRRFLGTLGPLGALAAGCMAPGGVGGGGESGLDELALAYDDTVVTQSARTVDFNGQAVLPRWVHVEKDGSGGEMSADVWVGSVVLGLTRDLTVRVALPYVAKHLDPAGGAASREVEGPGDVSVLGKHRFFQETGRAETSEAAVLFGVGLPTGDDDAREDGMRLPRPLQPGTGAVSGTLGGAFTRIDGRWLGNADLLVTVHDEGDDYRFGTEVRADVGCHYRVHPTRYERLDQTTVNLVLELNGRWAERDELDGDGVPDSGGARLFATPGVQLILSRRLLFEAAVQLPLALDLHGDQLEEDFVSIVGLRARF